MAGEVKRKLFAGGPERPDLLCLFLELRARAFYVRRMKRISFLLVLLTICAWAPVRAQDAATEERLNKLSGTVADLSESVQTLKSRNSALSQEIASLREQLGKPSPNYASQEDLERLKRAIEEVDRKRQEDYTKIHAELDKLIQNVGRVISKVPNTRPTPPNTPEVHTQENPDQKVFEYEVQKGDTLSLIIAAYREKNIKVTMDQVLKANPGLKATNLRVGQKIYIPAPKSLSQ